MEEERMDGEALPPEPQETYKPRPKWQIALAWFLLILMIIGTASYYYWIMYRY